FEGARPRFLAGLAELGATIGGVGAVLGAIFVPSPNPGLISAGAVPGDPGLRHAINHDEGTLRLTRGGEVAAAAQRGPDGIFYEAETGAPIARDVGGSIVFDAATLESVAAPKETTRASDRAVSATPAGRSRHGFAPNFAGRAAWRLGPGEKISRADQRLEQSAKALAAGRRDQPDQSGDGKARRLRRLPRERRDDGRGQGAALWGDDGERHFCTRAFVRSGLSRPRARLTRAAGGLSNGISRRRQRSRRRAKFSTRIAICGESAFSPRQRRRHDEFCVRPWLYYSRLLGAPGGTPEARAARFVRTIDRLQEIDPVFAL
ncbi:MAG: hypothetical protein ACREDJ_06715, partial [Methylocella sp.]